MADTTPTLEKADLVKAVRKMLQSDSAEVVNWSAEPLSGNWGNESSVGIYKVSGQAAVKDALVDWVLVLKIVQSPANKGIPWEGDEREHFLYWRREACLFETDFLDHVPPVFALPVCHGVVEQAGKVMWMWLEFVDNSCGKDWSLERYSAVARQLGRFNGAYLAGRSLPEYDWLSRDFLHQWASIGYNKRFMPYWAHADEQMLFWEHPAIQKAMGAPSENSLCRMIQELPRFLAMLDRLPQTLCHRDCWVTNLLCSADSEHVTLIDWQLVGIGPAGEDLTQLVWGMLEVQSAMDAEAVERQLFAAYVNGLRESGWQGDDRQVRFAYATAFALRAGYLTIWHLNDVLPLKIESPAEPQHYLATLDDERVARHLPVIEMVLRRAQEAWDLLGEVEGR